MGSTPNIWSDEWEFESDEEWAAGKSTRLPRGDKIGATVASRPGRDERLDHFHHGAEELPFRGRLRRRRAAPRRRRSSVTRGLDGPVSVEPRR